MQKLNGISIILLIVLSLIWGSSFILMKYGLVSYAWPQVASLRIAIAGLIFLPYVIYRFRKIRKLQYILLFGVLGVGAPPFLFTYAQTDVDSSTAGILNSLAPLFTLITGTLIFSVKANTLKIIGVFVGLLGAVFMIAFKHDMATSLDFSNAHGLFIVLATFMYGLGGNILKEKLQDVSSVLIIATSFVFMGIPAGTYLFISDFQSVSLSDAANLKSFTAIALLSIVGSALALVLFDVLVKKSTALFASFVTYLIPFVAISLGALDGENINYIHFLSLLLILLGIYIASWRSGGK